MEIGRRPLCDSEFNMLWTKLYKEFFDLSSDGTCDAAEVYNTIYRVCTSAIPYEDKLYWKIGDFLYNRCKEYRIKIEESKDYIKTYAECFEAYSYVLRAINRLSSFLNECIRGRRIDEFGYLLWERSVVQSLPGTFYEDVYNYEYTIPSDQNGSDDTTTKIQVDGLIKRTCNKSVRRIILQSFTSIIPDSTNPLLYYRERYEKLALAKLEYKHKNIYEITDVPEYTRRFHKIALRERHMAHDYFLPESSDKYEKILSECLLANAETISNRVRDYMMESHGRFRISGSRSKSTVDNYVIHPVNTIGDVFKLINPLIVRTNRKLKDYFNQTEEVTSDNIYNVIVRQLGVLDKGYSIVKKGYALYVIDIINKSNDLLGGSVEDISSLFHSLDILSNTNDAERIAMEKGLADGSLCSVSFARHYFNNLAKVESDRIHFGSSQVYDEMIHQEFREILVAIVKFALQRVKPCFITRICGAIDLLADKGYKGKETWEGSMEVIDLMHELVADKTELMNVYQSSLRDRLLTRCSCLKKEVELLRRLKVSEDEKLYKMVQDMGNNHHDGVGQAGVRADDQMAGGDWLTLLNSMYWGIEMENGTVRIPNMLLEKMISKYGGSMVGGVYRMSDKNVRIIHEYSKVCLMVNGRSVVANITQYSIIEALRIPRTFEELRESTNLNDKALRGVLELVLREGIVGHRNEKYYINSGADGQGDVDISALQDQAVCETGVCMNSHTQAVIARIMKNKKTWNTESVIKEAIALCKIEITMHVANKAIESLMKKGIIEKAGTSLEYVL